jgi:hypothetical protein
MSLWTGVSLAATLMHATSPIYSSAFTEGNKHNHTWHMDLARYIDLRTAIMPLLPFAMLIRHVMYIHSSSYHAAVIRASQVSWASETYYAFDRTICGYVSLVRG